MSNLSTSVAMDGLTVPAVDGSQGRVAAFAASWPTDRADESPIEMEGATMFELLALLTPVPVPFSGCVRLAEANVRHSEPSD